MAPFAQNLITLSITLISFLITLPPLHGQQCTGQLVDGVIKIGNAIYAFQQSKFLAHNQTNASSFATPAPFSRPRLISGLFQNIPLSEAVVGGYEHTSGRWKILTRTSNDITQNQFYRYDVIGGRFVFIRKQDITEVYPDLTDRIEIVHAITMLTESRILLIYKAISEVNTTYAIYSSENNSRVDTFIGQHRTTPSSIARLNERQALVLFGPFYGIVPLAGTTPVDISTTIRLTENRNNLFVARRWIGCPAELCTEGDLDAATGVAGRFILLRDNFVWSQPNFPSDQANLARMDLLFPGASGPIDAAFSNETHLFMVKGPETYIVRDATRQLRTERTSTVFGYANMDVRAATTVMNEVFLFIGCCWYQKFTMTSSFPFPTDGQAMTLTRFAGLPADIDAVVTAKNNAAFVFKGNFRAMVPASSIASGVGAAVDMRLSFRDLFRCDDNLYNFLDILEVTDYDSWLIYASNVRVPRPLRQEDIPGTSPRPTIAPRPSDGPTPPQPARSRGTLVALVIIAAISIMTVAAVSCVLMKRRRKDALAEDKDMDERKELTFRTIDTTPSVSDPSSDKSLTRSDKRKAKKGLRLSADRFSKSKRSDNSMTI